MPEAVLRDEPEAQCQQHLKHAALNIEIRPWKVSAVKINTTTPHAQSEAAEVDLDDIPHPEASPDQESIPQPEPMSCPEDVADPGETVNTEDVHPADVTPPTETEANVLHGGEDPSEPDQKLDKDEDSKDVISKEKTEVDNEKAEKTGSDGLRQCETVLIIEGNKSTGDLSLSNSPNTSMDADALIQSGSNGGVTKPESSDVNRNDSTQDDTQKASHDSDEGTSVDPKSRVKTDLIDLVPVDSDGLERPTSVKGSQGGIKNKDSETDHFEGTSVDPGAIKRTDQIDASSGEGLRETTDDDTCPNDIMSSNMIQVIKAEVNDSLPLDEVDTANISPDGRDMGKPEHITNNDQNITSLSSNDLSSAKEIPLSIEAAIVCEQEEKSYRPIAAVSPHVTDTPARSENAVGLQGQPAAAVHGLSDSEFTQVDVPGPSTIPQGLDGEEGSDADLEMADSNSGHVTSAETLTQTDTLIVAVHEEGVNQDAATNSGDKTQAAQDSLKEMSSDSPAQPTEAVMIQLTSGEVILLKEPDSPLKKMAAEDREEVVDQAVALRSVRGRSMTPLRPSRQSLKRRSRSLSPNSLEDAFFKMAEADSKQFIESAMQTESLSSGSSSPKSKTSPKSARKGKHKSKKLRSSVIDSGDDTSRSVSPIESSSESSALVQQALNTIRGAGAYGNTQTHPDISDSQSSRYGHNESVEVIHQESIAAEEATCKTSTACIQTGDSLTNIAGAITAIQDQGAESELDHSTMLIPDLNSSLGSTGAAPQMRLHLDQAGPVVDRGTYPSYSSPRGASTSTPLTGAQSLESLPTTTSRQESPHPPNKVSPYDSRRNEVLLDLPRGTTPDSNQGSHDSAESAVTVISAMTGPYSGSTGDASKTGVHKGRSQVEDSHANEVRTIETQTYPNLRVIETQTSTDLRVMETQTSPRQWAEAEATQTEISLDSSVQSLNSGPQGSSTLEVMVSPSSLSTAQQQETLSHAPTTITSQTEMVMEKYITPDLAEHVEKYGRKTKAVGGQCDIVEIGKQDGLNVALVDDTVTARQETSEDDQAGVEEENVSKQYAGSSKSAAPGQTSSLEDLHAAPGQTSRLEDTPGQTSSLEDLHSAPGQTSSLEDLHAAPGQTSSLEDLHAAPGQTSSLEDLHSAPGQTSSREDLHAAPGQTSSREDLPGQTSSLEDLHSDSTATSADQSQRSDSAAPGKPDDLDLSIPTIDLNTVDLETLKIEHQRLLDLMKKSKEEKERRISQRKLMLEERAAKVEGWMKQFDDLDNAEPKDTQESSDQIDNTIENTALLDRRGQPVKGEYSDETGNTRDGQLEGQETELESDRQANKRSKFSDDTFHTGGYPDDVETEVSPQVAKVSALSVSQSQSSSSSSESLATVKSVPPRSALPTASPLSVTSSTEDSVHTPPLTDKHYASHDPKDLSKKAESLVEEIADDLKPAGNEDVDEKLPEVVIDEATLDTANNNKLDSSKADYTTHMDPIVSQNTSFLDTSDFDNQSSNSSRLSAYGVKLDTSIESNQEISQGLNESTEVIPANIEGSVAFYGKSDEMSERGGGSDETPTTDRQSTADQMMHPEQDQEPGRSLEELKQVEDVIDPSSIVPTSQVKQPDSLMEPSLAIDSGNFEEIENLEEPSGGQEANDLDVIESLIEPSVEAGNSQSAEYRRDIPVPVATSSPSRKQKSKSKQAGGSGNFEDEGFSSLQSYLESENKPEDKSIEKELVISAGNEGPLSSIPRLMLDDDKIPLEVQHEPSKTDEQKLSPRSHQRSSSDGHKGIELEVPSADLNISASSSIEDWTQTDDLGEWSPRRGYADTGTDTETNDLLDELERLRRERQRILDMLAKDMMPSKLQVSALHSYTNLLSRACCDQ